MILDSLAEAMAESDAEDMLDEVTSILIKNDLLPKDYEHNSDPDALLSAHREFAEGKIVTFDCECIENDQDYASLLEHVISGTEYKNKIKEIHSEYDYDKSRATITCFVNGESFSAEWEQNSDWVSDSFFEFIDKILNDNFRDKLIILPAQDQCAETFIIDNESGEVLSKFFSIVSGNLDSDKVLGNKMFLIILFSVIAFLATIVAGWFFSSFWMSFGIGLLFWGGMAIWLMIKAVNGHEEQERLEEELRENPEMIGKLAQEFMNELKVNSKE